jgi:hypothetical protein
MFARCRRQRQYAYAVSVPLAIDGFCPVTDHLPIDGDHIEPANTSGPGSGHGKAPAKPPRRKCLPLGQYAVTVFVPEASIRWRVAAFSTMAGPAPQYASASSVVGDGKS